jgi:GT2 family glycosyltransferase/glycosyltransferase involved in cell wall biosynthesis
LDNLPPFETRAAWGVFDPVFYRAQYAAVLPDPDMPDDALAAFYHAEGAAAGHSPNRYFAERWYVATHQDVAALIAEGAYPSGFAHYLAEGFRDRSPHWLFSDRYYRANNPDLTRTRLDQAGFVNAYDHYLANGDREFRAGHLFFDPKQFAATRPGEDLTRIGPFAAFLATLGEPGPPVRLSWYFDPEWYLATYPDVSAQIASGDYSCALEHFLYNPTPRAYSPSPHFSEAYYTSVHVDLLPAITGGQFRNGFDHFIQFGVFECRRPNPEIDLTDYFRSVEVQADIQNGLCRDVFAHYVSKAAAGALTKPRILINEVVSREIFSASARHLRPIFARQKLDFSLAAQPPAISVIMVMFNKLDLTIAALDSLRRNFAGPIELILADSGSTDESRHVERYVDGTKIIRFSHNVGFLEACNAALGQVTGPVTLYLNNDILLQHGAVAAALRRLASAESIGAVGGKIIRTNGALQEAGCIIWRDGSTEGYLRDADPNISEANFVREVDFCSGVFLAVKTALLKELGGFDTQFKPAYFEETDLCIRIHQAGYKIIYDPAITVIHQEYSSGDSAIANVMMAQNSPKFRLKNQQFLRTRYPRNADLLVQARSPRGAGQRILFIEDRIPLRQLGSGFTRSNDIITTMAALGHQVTVFPIYRPIENILDIYRDFPDTVELIHDRELPDLHKFLEQRSGYFDILWIARTHNAERLLDILMNASRHLPINRIVLDTEAVAAPRDLARDALRGKVSRRTLDKMTQDELASAYFCQKIVAVNEQDAATIRCSGFTNVAILGHARDLNPGATPFAERTGLLFLGAIHDADSPNLDGLEWFAEHVLPILDAQLPEGVEITIAGTVSRRIDLSRLGGARRIILAGQVQDLPGLYGRHRVFFAPTRYAGGIPFKLHEAASFGLPIVASEILGQQLGWRNEVELLTAPSDAAAFAAEIVKLYTDEALWQSLRNGALARLEAENSFETYKSQISQILADVSL